MKLTVSEKGHVLKTGVMKNNSIHCMHTVCVCTGVGSVLVIWGEDENTGIGMMGTGGTFLKGTCLGFFGNMHRL